MAESKAATATPPMFRAMPQHWLLLLVAGVAFTMAGSHALRATYDWWLELPEYSHGVIVPFVCLFLYWQRRHEFAAMPFSGSWIGMLVALLGMATHYLGQLSALLTLQQYGLLVMLYGVLLALMGWQAFRQLWIPMLLLALAIPLPQFLLKNFSAQMQLISSAIGVGFIRLFGISVFLEGNVIDLGEYKLQVAEACDGLRYLFPLMTLGLIMACFYRAALWKRVFVFLSSIPLTILMNSFRIGVIGLTVEHWGPQMAEGFLHEFQGWVVFMASAALLVLEMVLLARIGDEPRSLREVFSIDLPGPLPAAASRAARPVPAPFIASVIALAGYAAFALLQPGQVEAKQPRASLATFPLAVGEWSGRPDVMEQVYVEALKLDDYVMATYSRTTSEPPVNFYVAWYDSQRAGQSAHSPRTCMPGGGWQITDLTQERVPGVRVGGLDLKVNRALIERGAERQLVYYWFQQRGRVVTNEYLVKWYILVDAVHRNRTDGAMVRVLTAVRSDEELAVADARLNRFIEQTGSLLRPYVPE